MKICTNANRQQYLKENVFELEAQKLIQKKFGHNRSFIGNPDY